MQICNDIELCYHSLINKFMRMLLYCNLIIDSTANVLNNLHTCIWVLWLYISDKIYYACLLSNIRSITFEMFRALLVWELLGI